jgi:hypothetical protein
MCSTVDSAKDTDITRQDIDLLPSEHKDVRRERAFLWYTRLGMPTRAEFKRKVTAGESINVTPRDIDLLPWNLTGWAVNVEKMKTLLTIKVEVEHKRRREERQRKREMAKNDMPNLDTQHKMAADHTTCEHKDVRRERAFLWYTRLGMPTRAEFKRKVTAGESINVTPRDIDLLPWNLTGWAVNVAKMKTTIRAS